jgi:hypothetical protein
MPRDSSGNYTLPSGNPVVTGTTIASSWGNTTMNDLATEMTDSLSRSGKGGMLAAFKIADGSVAAPGLAFASEPGSGLYRVSSGTLAIAVLGNEIVSFTVSGETVVTGSMTVGGVSVNNAAILTSGLVATAQLGSGTANSGVFLRGDQTWNAVAIGQVSGAGSLASLNTAAASNVSGGVLRQATLGSGVVTVQSGGSPSGGSDGDVYLIY